MGNIDQTETLLYQLRNNSEVNDSKFNIDIPIMCESISSSSIIPGQIRASDAR